MTGTTDPHRSPVPDAEEGLKARFGENVRLLRAHARISQEELAFRADVHRTQISLIESGQRLPKIGTALKLAAALDVDLATLLDSITYRPHLFSAARGGFEISSRTPFGQTGREGPAEEGTGR